MGDVHTFFRTIKQNIFVEARTLELIIKGNFVWIPLKSKKSWL